MDIGLDINLHPGFQTAEEKRLPDQCVSVHEEKPRRELLGTDD